MFTVTPVIEVTISYTDPAGESVTHTYGVQKGAALHEFSAPRRPDGPTEYRYKIKYFPADGPPVERDWVTSTGDRLTVPKYTVPRVGADFFPALIAFAATPLVEVDRSYQDAHRNLPERQTLTFTDKTKQSWFVLIDDNGPRNYQAEITYYLADGTPVKTPRVMLEKTSVTLPRYKPAEG